MEAWQRFAYELHVALGGLEEDEYLVISIKTTNFYVQFAAQGSFGMRAEAVSNFYVPEERSLVEGQHRALLELGWHAPTDLPPEMRMRSGPHDPDGSPNYFLDVERPVPHDKLALIAVNTLRSVFGASHPGNLEYHAFAKDKTSIRFPNLGIRRRRK